MRVLAIETSCDETAAAVLFGESGGPFVIEGHAIYSQIDLHQQYGGVYPEAASREHVAKMGVIIEDALSQTAKTTDNLQDWVRENIDSIAVTRGPGLIGSLLVGVNTAKTLAYAFQKPLLGINHHEGHIMAAWLETEQTPQLPAICLVVSGGHTKLILMRGVGDFTEIGRTRDDAVGEAFDKVARLMDLPYPGGPEIGRLAQEFIDIGNVSTLVLPRPMLDSGDLDFSFSGLKTAVASLVAKQGTMTDVFKKELAFVFQEAAVDVLVTKTVAALDQHQPKSLIVAGGVAANGYLRSELSRRVSKQFPAVVVHIPPIRLCTDNAAMIGAAALTRVLAGETGSWEEIIPDESWVIGQKPRAQEQLEQQV